MGDLTKTDLIKILILLLKVVLNQIPNNDQDYLPHEPTTLPIPKPDPNAVPPTIPDSEPDVNLFERPDIEDIALELFPPRDENNVLINHEQTSAQLRLKIDQAYALNNDVDAARAYFRRVNAEAGLYQPSNNVPLEFQNKPPSPEFYTWIQNLHQQKLEYRENLNSILPENCEDACALINPYLINEKTKTLQNDSDYVRQSIAGQHSNYQSLLEEENLIIHPKHILETILDTIVYLDSISSYIYYGLVFFLILQRSRYQANNWPHFVFNPEAIPPKPPKPPVITSTPSKEIKKRFIFLKNFFKNKRPFQTTYADKIEKALAQPPKPTPIILDKAPEPTIVPPHEIPLDEIPLDETLHTTPRHQPTFRIVPTNANIHSVLEQKLLFTQFLYQYSKLIYLYSFYISYILVLLSIISLSYALLIFFRNRKLKKTHVK